MAGEQDKLCMISGFVPTHGFPTVLAELEEELAEWEKLAAVIRERWGGRPSEK